MKHQQGLSEHRNTCSPALVTDGQRVVACDGDILAQEVEPLQTAGPPQHALRLVTRYTPVEVANEARIGCLAWLHGSYGAP